MKVWNRFHASIIVFVLAFLIVGNIACDDQGDSDDDEKSDDDDDIGDDDDDIGDDDDSSDDDDDTFETTEMVLVPECDFLMGCADGDHRCYDNEYPSHVVDVPDFFIDLYEVTYAQYAAYLNTANPLNECEGGYCLRTFWPVDISVLYYQTDGTNNPQIICGDGSDTNGNGRPGVYNDGEFCTTEANIVNFEQQVAFLALMAHSPLWRVVGVDQTVDDDILDEADTQRAAGEFNATIRDRLNSLGTGSAGYWQYHHHHLHFSYNWP